METSLNPSLRGDPNAAATSSSPSPIPLGITRTTITSTAVAAAESEPFASYSRPLHTSLKGQKNRIPIATMQPMIAASAAAATSSSSSPSSLSTGTHLPQLASGRDYSEITRGGGGTTTTNNSGKGKSTSNSHYGVNASPLNNMRVRFASVAARSTGSGIGVSEGGNGIRTFTNSNTTSGLKLPSLPTPPPPPPPPPQSPQLPSTASASSPVLMESEKTTQPPQSISELNSTASRVDEILRRRHERNQNMLARGKEIISSNGSKSNETRTIGGGGSGSNTGGGGVGSSSSSSTSPVGAAGGSSAQLKSMNGDARSQQSSDNFAKMLASFLDSASPMAALERRLKAQRERDMHSHSSSTQSTSSYSGAATVGGQRSGNAGGSTAADIGGRKGQQDVSMNGTFSRFRHGSAGSDGSDDEDDDEDDGGGGMDANGTMESTSTSLRGGKKNKKRNGANGGQGGGLWRAGRPMLAQRRNLPRRCLHSLIDHSSRNVYDAQMHQASSDGSRTKPSENAIGAAVKREPSDGNAAIHLVRDESGNVEEHSFRDDDHDEDNGTASQTFRLTQPSKDRRSQQLNAVRISSIVEPTPTREDGRTSSGESPLARHGTRYQDKRNSFLKAQAQLRTQLSSETTPSQRDAAWLRKTAKQLLALREVSHCAPVYNAAGASASLPLPVISQPDPRLALQRRATRAGHRATTIAAAATDGGGVANESLASLQPGADAALAVGKSNGMGKKVEFSESTVVSKKRRAMPQAKRRRTVPASSSTVLGNAAQKGAELQKLLIQLREREELFMHREINELARAREAQQDVFDVKRNMLTSSLGRSLTQHVASVNPVLSAVRKKSYKVAVKKGSTEHWQLAHAYCDVLENVVQRDFVPILSKARTTTTITNTTPAHGPEGHAQGAFGQTNTPSKRASSFSPEHAEQSMGSGALYISFAGSDHSESAAAIPHARTGTASAGRPEPNNTSSGEHEHLPQSEEGSSINGTGTANTLQRTLAGTERGEDVHPPSTPSSPSVHSATTPRPSIPGANASLRSENEDSAFKEKRDTKLLIQLLLSLIEDIRQLTDMKHGKPAPEDFYASVPQQFTSLQIQYDPIVRQLFLYLAPLYGMTEKQMLSWMESFGVEGSRQTSKDLNGVFHQVNKGIAGFIATQEARVRLTVHSCDGLFASSHTDDVDDGGDAGANPGSGGSTTDRDGRSSVNPSSFQSRSADTGTYGINLTAEYHSHTMIGKIVRTRGKSKDPNGGGGGGGGGSARTAHDDLPWVSFGGSQITFHIYDEASPVKLSILRDGQIIGTSEFSTQRYPVGRPCRMTLPLPCRGAPNVEVTFTLEVLSIS